jgi:hypothetical protein
LARIDRLGDGDIAQAIPKKSTMIPADKVSDFEPAAY